ARLSAPPLSLLCGLRRLALSLGSSLHMATRAVDVAPARRTHGRRDARLEHDVAERPDAFVRRAFVSRAGPWVERDELDLRRQAVLADQPHQLARMLVAVVLVPEHHIFEGDSPGVIGARIRGAGLRQLFAHL